MAYDLELIRTERGQPPILKMKKSKIWKNLYNQQALYILGTRYESIPRMKPKYMKMNFKNVLLHDHKLSLKKPEPFLIENIQYLK